MESSISSRGVVVLLVLVIVVMMQAAPHCMGRQIVSTRSRALDDAGLPFHTEEQDTFTPEKINDKVLKTYWIHRDHPDSPRSNNSNTSSSFAERVVAAGKRSLARTHYLSRRLVSSQVFDTQVMPEEGDYSMAVSVGTPPQQFIATADTGSDLVWLNCLPCIQCNSQPHGSPFDPSASTSYSVIPCTNSICQELPAPSGCASSGTDCEYVYSYGEGSTTEGELAFETFTVTNTDGSSNPVTNVVFGCGRNQSTGFFPDTDGLIGLGQGPLSLPSQFQNLYSDIFAYCLVPFISTTTNVSTFFFGMPEGNNLVYTSIIANVPNSPTYYYVNMIDISVGNTDLSLPANTFAISFTDGSGGIIFDSGTTLTILNSVAYMAVSQELQNQIPFPTTDGSQYGLDLCFDISSNPSSFAPPTMIFYFTDATTGLAIEFSLAQENIYVLAATNVVCTQIIMIPTSQAEPPSIIGNVAQADHQMVFDRVNGKIGWESTTC